MLSEATFDVLLNTVEDLPDFNMELIKKIDISWGYQFTNEEIDKAMKDKKGRKL